MVFENLEGTIFFLLQNGALNPVLFAEVCKVVISVFESTNESNDSGKEIYDLSVYLIADSTTFIMHT